jgi:hypothetical protein
VINARDSSTTGKAPVSVPSVGIPGVLSSRSGFSLLATFTMLGKLLRAVKLCASWSKRVCL